MSSEQKRREMWAALWGGQWEPVRLREVLPGDEVLEAELARLREENARLREALQQIEDLEEVTDRSGVAAKRIAIAALAQSTQESTDE